MKNEANNIKGIEETDKILLGVLIKSNGDTIEMQKELAQTYADKIGGTIHKIYIEEGISSITPIKNRAEIQEIMQNIENGDVNLVVAYRRDSLFRSSYDYLRFIQFLADHDCDIHFTAKGELPTIKTSEFKFNLDKFMDSILSNEVLMKELESKNDKRSK